MQQQKSIVMNNSYQDPEGRIKHSKRHQAPHQVQHQDSSKTNRTQRYGYSSSHNSIPSEPTCYICNSKEGTDDHVPTSGPGGTRMIQYFACKKFVELTPVDRLALLNEKGYCFQCLFPGTDATSLKHKEGRLCLSTSISSEVSYTKTRTCLRQTQGP